MLPALPHVLSLNRVCRLSLRARVAKTTYLPKSRSRFSWHSRIHMSLTGAVNITLKRGPPARHNLSARTPGEALTSIRAGLLT